MSIQRASLFVEVSMFEIEVEEGPIIDFTATLKISWCSRRWDYSTIEIVGQTTFFSRVWQTQKSFQFYLTFQPFYFGQKPVEGNLFYFHFFLLFSLLKSLKWASRRVLMQNVKWLDGLKVGCVISNDQNSLFSSSFIGPF